MSCCFDFDVAGVFLSGAFGDFDEGLAEGLELDEDAHVVDEAGEEGFVGEGVVDSGDEHFGEDADGDGVGPEVLGGEVRGDAAAAEELGEGGGDDDVFDGVEAEENDGAVDGADLSGEAVEGGVDDFEDARDEGGVVGDELVEVLRGGARVFDELDDFEGDLGEGGDVGDGVDGVGDDGLGFFFGGGGGWGVGHAILLYDVTKP